MALWIFISGRYYPRGHNISSFGERSEFSLYSAIASIEVKACLRKQMDVLGCACQDACLTIRCSCRRHGSHCGPRCACYNRRRKSDGSNTKLVCGTIDWLAKLVVRVISSLLCRLGGFSRRYRCCGRMKKQNQNSSYWWVKKQPHEEFSCSWSHVEVYGFKKMILYPLLNNRVVNVIFQLCLP